MRMSYDDRKYIKAAFESEIERYSYKEHMGNGFVAINPCDAVVLPKREIFEARYLTEQEQKVFLDMAKGYWFVH